MGLELGQLKVGGHVAKPSPLPGLDPGSWVAAAAQFCVEEDLSNPAVDAARRLERSSSSSSSSSSEYQIPKAEHMAYRLVRSPPALERATRIVGVRALELILTLTLSLTETRLERAARVVSVRALKLDHRRTPADHEPVLDPEGVPRANHVEALCRHEFPDRGHTLRQQAHRAVFLGTRRVAQPHDAKEVEAREHDVIVLLLGRGRLCFLDCAEVRVS